MDRKITGKILVEKKPLPDGRVIVGRGAIIDAVIVDSVQRGKK